MNIPGLGEVMGCIVAWRAWNHSPEGLRSVTMTNTLWKPGEIVTACCMDDMCGQHERFGTCGVWALKDRPTFGDVWGKVALWGEVIEHDKGYRAEHCYPVSFYEWPGLQYAQKYAEDYAVETDKPTYDELWAAVPKYDKRAFSAIIGMGAAKINQQQMYNAINRMGPRPFSYVQALGGIGNVLRHRD